jgi:hypothetical protein
MTANRRHVLTPLALLLAGAGLAACGTTGSTSNFKGERHAVAEAISNFASSATTADAHKICSEDLAKSVTSRLEADGSSCKKALEGQLAEIDNYELTVKSVDIKGDTATATVKTTESGKSRERTVSLVREGRSWKIAGVS